MIDRGMQLDVFRAQTDNVRELALAWTQLERAINDCLRRNKMEAAALLSKSLALVFCAWAEANFSKLIHTPYAFELEDIEQIKIVWSQHGLGEGWKKALDLGLLRAPNRGRSNYLPNVRQAMARIIDDYVVSPSLVRNKIAHGQWVVAFNRENTKRNADVTAVIQALDCVMVDRWREAHRVLAEMMENLIESPDRAFHRDYWPAIARLEGELKRREGWTLADKVQLLRRKPFPR